MPEYLRDHMKLKAVGDTPVPSSLDVMAKMVYQCALSNQTIGEAAGHCGLDQTLVYKIVHKLVSANLVNVSDSIDDDGVASAAPAQTAVIDPEVFDSLRNTETFAEKVNKLFEACHYRNYYDLLGVDPDTPRATLRKRYFELSKQFHPDRAIHQDAKAQKDKMAVVFQKLTTAYETLSNRNKKAEYDASIADQLELRALERSLTAAVAESTGSNPPDLGGISTRPPIRVTNGPSANSTSPSVTNDPPKGSTSPPVTGQPTRTTSTAKDAQNCISRSRVTPSSVKRSSLGSTPRSSPPEMDHQRVTMPPNVNPRRTTTSPHPKADVRRQQMKRKLAGRAMAELLSRRSMPPQPTRDLEKTLDDAVLAMEQDRFLDAANMVKAVLKQDPENEKAKALFTDAGRKLAQSQARHHMRRSRYAIRDGEIDQAKWHLEQALVIDSESVDARHQLAELLLVHEKDVHRALALMKEVIVLGGQRAKYFVTLGEIFFETGDLERASGAFGRALQLEPDNRVTKKRLKLCSR